jgi:CRP-like cAMP-binding protein
MFLVSEGALDVRLSVSNGEEVAVDRMVPGDLFGEISLLTGAPRGASIVATTDAVLYEMCKDDIDPLLRRRPELGASLAALMAERQRLNMTRMQALEQGLDGAALPSSEDLLRRLRSFFGLAARN